MYMEEKLNDLVMHHVWHVTTPGLMYNAMINPVAGVAMRGAIWYQGESNVGDGFWFQNRPYGGDGFYEQKMEALIGSWRKAWNIGEFPFYFVQLAPYKKYTGEPLARNINYNWIEPARLSRADRALLTEALRAVERVKTLVSRRHRLASIPGP